MVVTNSKLKKNSKPGSQQASLQSRKRKAAATNSLADQSSKNHRPAPPKKPSAAESSKGMTSASHRQAPTRKASTRSWTNEQRQSKQDEYVPVDAWCKVEVSQELALFPNNPRRQQG